MSLTCHTNGVRTEPLVALTFDDGPNPPVTGQVLDLLAEAGATATFFVIGQWVERWPDTLRRIVAEGHTVGNHTQTHVWGIGDYDVAEPGIAAITGRPSRFARAPAFDYDSCSQSQLVTSGALTLVDADVNPSDWDCADPEVIARRTLDHPLLQGGSIVDLHDGFDRHDDAIRRSRPQPMLKALPAILHGLKARGLKPVGLDAFSFGPPRLVAEVQADRMHARAQDVARQRPA